jgi:hypothetical protein
MPTRIGPAGSVRVAVLGSASGQNIVNVFWCSLTASGTVTQADLDTWTASFGSNFKTDFLSSLPSNYSFVSVNSTYFVDGTATNVLQSTQNLTGAGSGGAQGDLAVAVCVSWSSSAYWRGGKPRTYLLAISTAVSSSTPKNVSSSAQTSYGSAATAFLGHINALTAGTTITATKLGFVSFDTAGAARTTPLFFAFTGKKIHPRLAHQRRRDGKWVA